KVQPAAAILGYHVGADLMDFSTSKRFGYVRDLFVAESGAIVPLTGAQEYAGYKVVRVDPRTGRTSDFITPVAAIPDRLFTAGGYHRPVDVKFRGKPMYIVDFGAFEPGIGIQRPASGRIWVVTRNSSSARN